MQLHERCVSEDQRKGAYQPYRRSQIDRAGDRMKPESSGDVDEDPACQKWERSSQSYRPLLCTLSPDFRVCPAPMKPVAGKEPVSEGRGDTSANNYRGQRGPVHSSLAVCRLYFAR